MISYGSEHAKKKENNIVEEAVRTVRALSRTVPPALAGITVKLGLCSSCPEDRPKRKLLCTWTVWTKSPISDVLGFWASPSEEPSRTAPSKLGEATRKTWTQARPPCWLEPRPTLKPNWDTTKVPATSQPTNRCSRPSILIDRHSKFPIHLKTIIEHTVTNTTDITTTAEVEKQLL